MKTNEEFRFERFQNRFAFKAHEYSTIEQCQSNDFVKDFYETCEKVSNKALNLDVNNPLKLKYPGTYVDIDEAIQGIMDLCKKFPNIDIAELLSIIKEMHGYTHQKTKVVLEDWGGKWLNLAELPPELWNRFSQYAQECISIWKQPDSWNAEIFESF